MKRTAMKFLLPATLALSVGLLAYAQPANPPPKETENRGEPGRAPEGPARGEPGAPRRGPGGTPQNLEGAMKFMNGNLKRLKNQVADSTKKDDNLRLVNEAQKGAVIAKGMDTTEAFAKETDPIKKAKMNLDFRRKMIELVEHLVTLEKQILDDKTDDAVKSVEWLYEFRKTNHEAFGVKD